MIRAAEYAAAASALKHVFLVGDLQQPAPHPFVRDTRVEVIACFYEAGDDGLPHWHADVTEYEFVLEGRVGYQFSSDQQIVWFEPGDLSVIESGVCVRRLVSVRSRTLALKVPSRPSDKIHCGACRRECSVRLEPFGSA